MSHRRHPENFTKREKFLNVSANFFKNSILLQIWNRWFLLKLCCPQFLWSYWAPIIFLITIWSQKNFDQTNNKRLQHRNCFTFIYQVSIFYLPSFLDHEILPVPCLRHKISAKCFLPTTQQEYLPVRLGYQTREYLFNREHLWNRHSIHYQK